MDRWDYLEVLVGDRAWVDSNGRWGELALLDVGHGRWKSFEWESVAELLNELGGDGWELAGVANGQNNHRLFFKRPRG